MRRSIASLAALHVTIGTLLCGCAGGSRAGTSAARGAAAEPRLAEVHCGAPPVVGASLSRPRAEMLKLPGTPDGIASTPDGGTSFVAIQSGSPRIVVIANRPGGERLLGTVALPAYASGLNVTPDGRYALGAAGRGAVVLDVTAARGGGGRGLLGSLAVPASVAGAGPGAAEVALSRDSRYAFVTLERAGLVAVFDLKAAISRGLGTHGYLGSIPVGPGALGITVSPDGRWLYEVSESAPNRSAHGHGTLNAIDVKRAVNDPARSITARAAAACAPVRVAVSPDGKTVWVTARDGNALLGFSALALQRDTARALASVTRVGPQPLGLAVADGGRKLLVADSDLAHARGSRSAVSIINTASPGKPVQIGSVPAGELADAISAPATGDLALVTNSDSRQLEVLHLQRLK
jgi:DNA-binding beta-propeller fold protein YncE